MHAGKGWVNHTSKMKLEPNFQWTRWKLTCPIVSGDGNARNVYVLLRDRDHFEWGRRWSVVGSWRDRQQTQWPAAMKKRPVETRSPNGKKTFYVFWMWKVNSRRRSFLFSPKLLRDTRQPHGPHTRENSQATPHTHALSVTHNNTHRVTHRVCVL